VTGRGAAPGKDYKAVAGIGSGELYAEQVFDALRRGIPEGKLASGERISLEAQGMSGRIGAS
jgi:DNA-binding GntR family transcriptional regulator